MILDRIHLVPPLDIDREGIANSEGLLEPAKFMTHHVDCYDYLKFNDYGFGALCSAALLKSSAN